MVEQSDVSKSCEEQADKIDTDSKKQKFSDEARCAVQQGTLNETENTDALEAIIESLRGEQTTK